MRFSDLNHAARRRVIAKARRDHKTVTGKISTGRPIIKPMGDMVTPRKCDVCQRPATHFRYVRNRDGAKDETSRRPVCGDHVA
jgi:hypothetical protein